MRAALAIATGMLTASAGYSVTTVKGFIVCVTATFIVMAFYGAIKRDN